MRLKENSIPVKQRPRKVPVYLQDAFHQEVQRFESVAEQSEWVNSFVMVEKVVDSSNPQAPNHSIQWKKAICLRIDPKDVNNSLEREPYYCRTIDELISMFSGAKVTGE